jgi:putative ABC transport system permease protein
MPGGFVPRVVTMSEQARVALSRERLLSILASFFGALALLLASVGLYGVVAYGVVRRTREIGIRLAIGATRRSVIRLIVGETMTVVACGVLLGVVAAAAASRLVRNQLFGVSPGDSLAIAAAVAVLLAVAVVATGLPARRAARVDPVTALRCE